MYVFRPRSHVPITEEIHIHTGVKQGWSVSPFLFFEADQFMEKSQLTQNSVISDRNAKRSGLCRRPYTWSIIGLSGKE